ncbi:MAG: long-chain fatty acid--CoA ligase [Actinomycetota bacterium]
MEPIWLAHYPEGVNKSITIPEMPVPVLLDKAAAEFPNRPALDFQGSRTTYAQLKSTVDRFAKALSNLGVAKGTRVGILMPNIPQNVITYYAALRLGAIVVENNPLYTERELTHQLEDAGVEVLVTLDLFYDKIKDIRPHLPKLREVIVTDVFDGLHGLKSMLGRMLKGKELSKPVPASDPVHQFRELLRATPHGAPQTPIDARTDLALLQYTGGTTGLSKGVMLTHYNLVANVMQNQAWLPDLKRGKEVVVCALPIFHSYGQTVCMNLGLSIGGMLVLVPNPRDFDAVLKTIDRTHPTLFSGVPTLFIALLNNPNIKTTDMRSIRACISGAAPLPVEVQEQWERVTGGKIVEGFGLSETSPSSHCNPVLGKRKIGTIGVPLPNTDSKLVDVEDPSKEVDPPGPGEICIKGPQVMQGYWNRPEETAEVLKDGWLHTGDIAEVDSEGYFKIVDRKKDMILVGGFNVYPRDVEEVLYQNPKILEAAVAGIPDARSGESVKAFVVLRPGQTSTPEEIIAFCRESLTPYKVPKSVEFRPELPKTMVGKVLRRQLVEEEKAKIKAQG